MVAWESAGYGGPLEVGHCPNDGKFLVSFFRVTAPNISWDLLGGRRSEDLAASGRVASQ